MILFSKSDPFFLPNTVGFQFFVTSKLFAFFISKNKIRTLLFQQQKKNIFKKKGCIARLVHDMYNVCVQRCEQARKRGHSECRFALLRIQVRWYKTSKKNFFSGNYKILTNGVQ